MFELQTVIPMDTAGLKWGPQYGIRAWTQNQNQNTVFNFEIHNQFRSIKNLQSI